MTPRPRRRPSVQKITVILGVAVTSGLLAPQIIQSAASSPAPTTSTERLAPDPRPNVVVIMTDDMRQSDLRWMPKTRRLLANQGARFTHSFAPYPLCCPARASFLSGQYTHNHGVWSHREPFGFASFDDDSTLPVWLHDAGYNTAFLGKYLNGYGVQSLPGGRSSVRYIPPGWTDWRGAIGGGLPRSHPKNGGVHRYFDTTLNVNGTFEGHQGEYQTKVLGDESVNIVKTYARRDAPFFLWANYVAPHKGSPVERDDPRNIRRRDGRISKIVTPAVPARVRGRFNDRIRKPAGLPTERDVSDKPWFIRQLPRINRSERQAMVEAARQRAEALSVVDSQVARTVATLRDAGELRKTYVMFTSDNGFFEGEHRIRQGKTLPYEPSLRTPLLVRGPGVPRGVVRTAPFLSIDFAPTILRVAGAGLPSSIDGQSGLDEARHGGTWRRPVLTETGGRSSVAGATEAGAKLAVPAAPAAAANEPYTVGVRTSRYLFVRHLSGERELYDMRRDPRQLNNVAGRAAYAADQRRMNRVLQDLRECAGDACRRPLSSW